MNPNKHEQRKAVIRLSWQEYSAILNTTCQGSRLLKQLDFKPKLSPSGSIYCEANGTEDDAEAIYSWSDFCYR